MHCVVGIASSEIVRRPHVAKANVNNTHQMFRSPNSVWHHFYAFHFLYPKYFSFLPSRLSERSGDETACSRSPLPFPVPQYTLTQLTAVIRRGLRFKWVLYHHVYVIYIHTACTAAIMRRASESSFPFWPSSPGYTSESLLDERLTMVYWLTWVPRAHTYTHTQPPAPLPGSLRLKKRSTVRFIVAEEE